MNDPSVNFYDVQSSFNKFWKKEERKEKFKHFFTPGKKSEEENEGLILYKRWENYVEPRVYPSGDRSLLSNNAKESALFISDHSNKSSRQFGGSWQPLGASTVPLYGGGAGRLNCVRFNPSNPNIIYAGAPVGGLWASTNNGFAWSTSTDDLPTLGVNDVAVDPVDPNIMYLATGDMDANDSYGVGILKSIDGGSTWNMTGFSTTIQMGRYASRVLINPNDHNMIFAGTSLGLFKSIDAGVTWVKVLATTPVRDLEFKPGDPTVIYAVASKSLYRSINSGNTFTIIPSGSGLPAATSVSRAAIAVTAADPSYVYVVYSDAGDNSFFGVYRSTNSGVSFNLQTNYPNLLGWDPDGSDAGGQGWYTLSIAASPINKNEVIVGGVNVWKSTNGGVNWNINAHWYGGGAPYVHADIHDLIYRPDGSAYYAACDGGIFETQNGGNSWQDLSDGLQIGQMYRLGCSATNPDKVIQGWQDNGTNFYNDPTWEQILGGDGFECFIDWSDENTLFAEIYYGDIYRSNGGSFFSSIKNNIDEDGDWNTPWQQDPIDPQTLYAGYKNVWKSTDKGDYWTKISNFTIGNIKSLKVAPSNSDVIYISNGSSIYKTVDGGNNWSMLTIPMTGSIAVTYITVSGTDPNTVWFTRSGYDGNNKVFKSTNGGAAWTNLSSGLPNLPVNCIVNQAGTNDGVYVGTDVGIYYLDNNQSTWVSFSNGLPNVVIDELEIQYSSNKLRAATYGRGLWETTIFNPSSTLPLANFVADSTSGCPGLTVQFADSSSNSPTAWDWQFPGGTPSTSNLQNPIITYNAPGTYHNVKLIVTNSAGTDSVIKNSYIAISPYTKPTITVMGNDSICSGTAVQLKASYGQSYLWMPNGQSSYIASASSTGTYSVTVTDAYGCKTTSNPTNIYVLPTVPTPTITVNGDTLFSSSATGNQWYYNGTAIAGATDQTYIGIVNGGIYYVKVSGPGNICSAISSTITGIDDQALNGIGFSVYPNPSDGISSLTISSEKNEKITIQVTDMMGKLIYKKEIEIIVNQQLKETIDLSKYSKGIYMLKLSSGNGNATQKLVVY